MKEGRFLYTKEQKLVKIPKQKGPHYWNNGNALFFQVTFHELKRKLL